ncbi:MAG: hypothetical protein AAF402_01900 [Pseudomonadota bacterium]
MSVTQVIDDQYLPLWSALLEASGLPTDDLNAVNWASRLGVIEDRELVAAGGIEFVGDCFLLRSVVTRFDRRNSGYGTVLVNALHGAFENLIADGLYLLTIDSAEFFRDKFGYRITDRSEAPSGIQLSAQFSRLCPDSAVLMRWSP